MEFETSRCKKIAASLYQRLAVLFLQPIVSNCSFMANFWRETQTTSSGCKQITSSNFFTVTSLELKLNQETLPLTDTNKEHNGMEEWGPTHSTHHGKPPINIHCSFLGGGDGIGLGIGQCE